MKKNMQPESYSAMFTPYQPVNISIAAIILGILLYSALFTPGENTHPVRCVYIEYAGTSCPTCGLSEGFSQMVRGNLAGARESNVNTIPLFSFFLLQLFMRAFASFALYRNMIPKKLIAAGDSSLSLVLFLLCFRNLIFFWI